MQKNNGFTLMEILIVMGLLMILAVGALIAINPLAQLARVKDSQRKSDITLFKKTFEDYYNDKQAYPGAADVCYDTPKKVYNGKIETSPPDANLVGYTCNICGTEQTTPSLEPYLSKLPCDPSHPSHNYLYYIPSATSPRWYQIFTDFDSARDLDSDQLGCTNGACGLFPTPAASIGTLPWGYDYGGSSPNRDLDHSTQFVCLDAGTGGQPKCNVCRTYQECIVDSGCKGGGLKIYSSPDTCCASNPQSYPTGKCR